jgi:hypothetical protein
MSTSYQRKLITGIPKGQNWGCFSFLRSKENEKISVVGIRLAGVYMTLEEAQNRAKEVQQEDNRFHVFVGELNGDFLPFDPAPNSVFVSFLLSFNKDFLLVSIAESFGFLP